MSKKFLCAAVAGLFSFAALGVENTYALSALAQGKPSCKPTAPAGGALYNYQLNCDPGFPNDLALTFQFSGPVYNETSLTNQLQVTNVLGVAPYVLTAFEGDPA